MRRELLELLAYAAGITTHCTAATAHLRVAEDVGGLDGPTSSRHIHKGCRRMGLMSWVL